MVETPDRKCLFSGEIRDGQKPFSLTIPDRLVDCRDKIEVSSIAEWRLSVDASMVSESAHSQ